MNIAFIEKVQQATRFHQIVDALALMEVPTSEQIAKLVQNMHSHEIVIPVLGLQGTGKSTLINALLMESEILPVDVCETTCVPVEVRYAAQQTIKIFFNDKREPVECHHPRGIVQYVHNECNPGNTLGVSHVVVGCPNPILQGNLVVVDLPGTGSLTKSNMETTMRYIERLAGAIFLLRTVPPMTREEANFVSIVWPKLSTAWFVQNQWNDESSAEVLDAIRHNQVVLTRIAERYGTKTPEKIRIVNAYKALEAKLQGDARLLTESGLEELTAKLWEIKETWSTQVSDGFTALIHHLVQQTIVKLRAQRENLELSRVEVAAKFRDAEQQAQEHSQNILKQVDDVQRTMGEHKEALKTFVEEISQRQFDNLSKNMRRVVDAGVTDGEKLSRAFQNNQDECVNEATEELAIQLNLVVSEIKKHLDQLAHTDSQFNFQTGKFEKESTIKTAKALPYILPIMAGPAAAFAKGLIAKALGVAALTNPVGAVVAIGLALALASWLGAEAREYAAKGRASKTMAELGPHMIEFRRKLKEGLMAAVDQAFVTMGEAFDAYRENKEQEVALLKRGNDEFLKKMSDKENEKVKIASDLNYVQELEADLFARISKPTE